VLAVAAAVAFAAVGAAAAATAAVSIERKAELLAGLAVEVQVNVTCPAPELTTPINLNVQLQQLQKTHDGSVVVSGSGFVSNATCDGAKRTYPVLVRTFASVGQPLPLFRRGPALATATLFSCSTFCSTIGTQAFAEVRIAG
jgi:hypothetical protein